MTVHVGHVSIALGCIIASLLLLYGYMGYQKLQAANICKMTYSKPRKTEMKLADENPWSYKLWKLTNADSKRFNKYPVLFIPGHLGSADQARSFASYVHNEDNSLQYFAVDFHSEVIGLHASDILHKAAFVNVALRTIISVYQAQGYLTDDIHVTLLGHSYGGYVAKTSIVLSNHPRPCAVDLIVMLSTPNTQAALVPDSSHDVLYRTINKAWYTPFYEHNKHCESRSKASNGELLLTLSLSSDCRSCVPNIQLLSLVGGENDIHIDPSSSDVFAISAHPRNTTSHPVKGSSGSGVVPQLVTFELIGMVKGYVKRQFNAVLSLFSVFSSSKISVVTTDQTVTESTVAAEENNTITTELKPVLDPSSPYAFITSENWYKHIAQYTEPRHITVRASQMIAVGFPVDHYAILWCHQFVSSVSTAIKHLVSHSTDPSAAFDLHTVLNIRAQEHIENATIEAAKLGISELTDYIRRNVSNTLFVEGKKVDEQYIFDQLDGNYVQYWLVVKFILRLLPTVVVFTFVLSLLMLISSLLRAIEGGQPSSVYVVYSLPISLDLVPIELALTTTWEAAANAAGSSWNLLSCILSVLAVLVYRFKHLATLALVQDMMGCLMAFFLACTVRVILVLSISFLQLIYRSFCAFLRVIYVRKVFKSLSKRLFGKAVMIIWSVVPEAVVTALVVVVMYIRNRSLSQVIGESGLLLSIMIVWLYGSLLLRVVMSLIGVDGKYLNKRTIVTQNVVSEMSVLYLFGLAAAAPSMLFALKQTLQTEDAFLYNSQLFDMLSSTRVNYILVLLTMWISSRYFANRDYEYKAEVWSFLAVKSSNKKTKRAKEAVTECIHEDGGKNAVFQSVHSSEAQVLNNGSIIIGATYKVVKCFCPSDRELKTSDEWCEWCRCTKCGYGSRMKYSAEADNVPTLSTDILMIVPLAGAAGFVLIYGQLQFYIVLVAISSVGASFVARNWYGRGTIVLTMPAL